MISGRRPESVKSSTQSFFRRKGDSYGILVTIAVEILHMRHVFWEKTLPNVSIEVYFLRDHFCLIQHIF
jgi:hypothetical protein